MSEPSQSVCLVPAAGEESPSGDEPESSAPEPPGGEPQDDLSESACTLTIDIELDVPDCDPPIQGWLAEALMRLAGLAGVSRGRLGLAVVGDDQMSQMHQQYCDIAGTTDVLTFDMRDEAKGNPSAVDGDIVICLDEAARQAKQRGHDVRLEALLYALHGLMHLLGEDDHDEAAYRQMHRREDDLLTRAGFGPLFGISD